MRFHSFVLVLAAAVATPALAQSTAMNSAPSPTADIRIHWQMMSGYVIRSAMDVPEDKYAFRPTPGVRSFGELFAHVAGAQSMFCAMALGEKTRSEESVTVRTKADLVAALQQSNEYCERAYAQTDLAASASIDVFGTPHSRLYALMMNATHDAEHYGNLITYMRMNGLVPPSSQPTR